MVSSRSAFTIGEKTPTIVFLGSSVGRAVGCKERRMMAARRRHVDLRDPLCRLPSEIDAGLQLPRETVVEKSGEFREAFPAFVTNAEGES